MLIHVRAVTKLLYKELEKLKPRDDIFNQDNIKIFNEFWKSEYEHRDLVDVDSARNDFNRALKIIGQVSLRSATKEQLQNRVSSKIKGNSQRRVVASLNSILKYLKREVKLRKDKPNQVLVKHLNETEFLEVLSRSDDSFFNSIFYF